MPSVPDPLRVQALLVAARARPAAPDEWERLLVVDVPRQRLVLCDDAGRGLAEYPVSTAAAGIGGAEGSLQTPPGWHRIHARIGAGAPSGARFVSRAPTGEVWDGEPRAEDLILSRILTLEGLEDGVNRGPGRDSLERFIYLHGTNHEDALGRAASHGCVRLSNADVIELSDRVREGDPLVVLDQVPLIPLLAGRFHYAGIGGSGMSALAQFQVMRGGRASGSDRAFDRGERAGARAQLERLCIGITPQDGSGVAGSCATLVVSSAVEDQVPDVAAARARGVPVAHRSEVLADLVASHRTVAVTGTSGKSTVVAMIFEILRGAGRDPSVVTGGDLVVLQREGLWGNAWAGGSDLLVVEADESDGSVVRYAPAVGVILNLQRDHREMDEVAAMFAAFRARTRETAVLGEGGNLAALARDALVFGFGPLAAVRGEEVALAAAGSAFEVDGVRFMLPAPGRHNIENALAAIAACRALGVPLAGMVEPLARFQGVGRRFQPLGGVRGVEVVDDFAHNPAKLAAAIATAQARVAAGVAASAPGPPGPDAAPPAGVRPGRVLAVYQPHGYGPTRFLRRDLVETFAAALGPEDRLWMLEVFYAGGSALRDFSAADIVAEIAARGARAEFAPSRAWLVERIAAEACAGDLVLVMGARDPSLTGLARDILAALEPARAPEAR
ncbi:MAG: L,D-transpeptidase family protein [Candidatus Eisenbacteria bacterium]|nr:L,D-transpeptidase family protein [Candidatus Eisenbacteria bacterium]